MIKILGIFLETLYQDLSLLAISTVLRFGSPCSRITGTVTAAFQAGKQPSVQPADCAAKSLVGAMGELESQNWDKPININLLLHLLNESKEIKWIHRRRRCSCIK